MLDLDRLAQLTAFADLGTLARAAEAHHLSTPSLTRSMQTLEEDFGVPLFTRSKNRIALNETGEVAVACARRLLAEADRAVEQVRAFDQRSRTVVVRSCAPAPLWELLRQLDETCPGMTVSSRIVGNEEVLAAWADGSCALAILPFPLDDGAGETRELFREQLYVCVPPEHELAMRPSLTFADIDGVNFLLRSELGFWDALCRRRMPASRFLVQTDEFTFRELVASSSLPCFTTDYGQRNLPHPPGWIDVPLTDPEANVTFYLTVRKTERARLHL